MNFKRRPAAELPPTISEVTAEYVQSPGYSKEGTHEIKNPMTLSRTSAALAAAEASKGNRYIHDELEVGARHYHSYKLRQMMQKKNYLIEQQRFEVESQQRASA